MAKIIGLCHIITALLLVLSDTVSLPCDAFVLENFQVTQPAIVPKDSKQCTVKILQRNFAHSYGSPEIVQYSPPSGCGLPGTWAAVTLNFTVTSNGTQYDRLGIFTFQNVEIWRTSTPEPTRGDGIIWTYIKDVTKYTPLFAKNGAFILQLDNIIQTGLDGVYSTVLHATFYTSSRKNPPAKTSDLIIPLSTFKNDTGNHASVPPGFSINVTLPRNSVRIFAELYASGNAQEEFWYYNVPNSVVGDLPPDTAYGQGPFREVRLLVDGRLAGVAFPYVTIFTGGFVPAVWRPISSYGALDLPTYFLDLTTFAPLLANGQPHLITIDVASAEPDHAILHNWYVSGVLQVFTDKKSTRPTTGAMVRYSAEPFARTRLNAGTELGDTHILVSATRQIDIEAIVISGSGEVNRVVSTQKLQFSNEQLYIDNARIQIVNQSTIGRTTSMHNGVPVVIDTFNYPLVVNYTVLTEDGRHWTTTFDHSYNRDLLPLPLSVQSSIKSRQTASGYYTLSPTGNFGNGTNNSTFIYSDEDGNTYRRRVNAAYNNITLDIISGTLGLAVARRPHSEQSDDVPPVNLMRDPVRLPGPGVHSRGD